MKRIDAIQQKLQELRSLDKGFAIFGSSRHEYRMKSPLTEEKITHIEQKHGITLSREYREILIHLGNGGAGCGYGLESFSLKHIDPPYVGTKHLLRNWDDPKTIDVDMVDTDEISGYVRLFNHGCGMETCLIVKGEEAGDMIFFDCDDRFEKLEQASLLDMYEKWLDDNLATLRRVQGKLDELPLQEVVDSEWELNNFSVKEMILSLIGGQPLRGGHSGRQLNVHLEKEYRKWKAKP